MRVHRGSGRADARKSVRTARRAQTAHGAVLPRTVHGGQLRGRDRAAGRRLGDRLFPHARPRHAALGARRPLAGLRRRRAGQAHLSFTRALLLRDAGRGHHQPARHRTVCLDSLRGADSGGDALRHGAQRAQRRHAAPADPHPPAQGALARNRDGVPDADQQLFRRHGAAVHAARSRTTTSSPGTTWRWR